MNNKLIYLAVPYSHPDEAVRLQRFETVTLVSALLIKQGVVNFSPITQSHEQAESHDLPGDWAFWETVDKVFLDRCDELYVLALPGWKDSVGVTAEIEHMKNSGKPIRYVSLNEYKDYVCLIEEVTAIALDAPRAPQGGTMHEREEAGKPYVAFDPAPNHGADDFIFIHGDTNSYTVERRPLNLGDSTRGIKVDDYDSSEATKYDSGKPPLSLLPREALEGVAEVLAFGAEKYDVHNWRKGMKWSRLLDATLRHIVRFADREDCDEESNLSHLAHAACNLCFLMHYQINNRGDDDRRK